MSSHPTAKHIFDIVVIRFFIFNLNGKFLEFSTHCGNSIRVYSFDDFTCIRKCVLDLQEFVFARNLNDSGFLTIDMDSKFSCYFTDVFEQVFKLFFTGIHNVPIVHIPSIKFLLTYILDVIVNRIWIVNSNDLRKLISNIDRLLHPLFASELLFWNVPILQFIESIGHTGLVFLVRHVRNIDLEALKYQR